MSSIAELDKRIRETQTLLNDLRIQKNDAVAKTRDDAKRKRRNATSAPVAAPSEPPAPAAKK